MSNTEYDPRIRRIVDVFYWMLVVVSIWSMHWWITSSEDVPMWPIVGVALSSGLAMMCVAGTSYWVWLSQYTDDDDESNRNK